MSMRISDTTIDELIKIWNNEIYGQFGSVFVDNIGLQRIRKIPTLSEKEINFQYGVYSKIDPNDLRYPVCQGLCRGQDRRQHAFVLMKVDHCLENTVMKMVLLIIDRLPIGFNGKNSGIPQHNYVAMIKSQSSAMYQVLPNQKKDRLFSEADDVEGMSEKQIKQIADLFDGKKINMGFDGYMVKSNT